MKSLFLCALLALGLALQMQAQTRTPGSPAAPLAAAATTVSNAASSAAASVPPDYIADDKHKLRIGDRVSFQIVEDRLVNLGDQAKPLMVTDSSEVDVPYVGRIRAVDKTCKQLADEIKVLLEKDYYHRATVVLALDVANRVVGKVYLWGAVRATGPMDLLVNEDMTAGKALLRAGFAEYADKGKVRLVRPSASGSDKDKQIFILDMKEILEKGKSEKDVVLKPEDFIIVPTGFLNF